MFVLFALMLRLPRYKEKLTLTLVRNIEGACVCVCAFVRLCVCAFVRLCICAFVRVIDLVSTSICLVNFKLKTSAINSGSRL